MPCRMLKNARPTAEVLEGKDSPGSPTRCRALQDRRSPARTVTPPTQKVLRSVGTRPGIQNRRRPPADRGTWSRTVAALRVGVENLLPGEPWRTPEIPTPTRSRPGWTVASAPPGRAPCPLMSTATDIIPSSGRDHVQPAGLTGFRAELALLRRLPTGSADRDPEGSTPGSATTSEARRRHRRGAAAGHRPLGRRRAPVFDVILDTGQRLFGAVTRWASSSSPTSCGARAAVVARRGAGPIAHLPEADGLTSPRARPTRPATRCPTPRRCPDAPPTVRGRRPDRHFSVGWSPLTLGRSRARRHRFFACCASRPRVQTRNSIGVWSVVSATTNAVIAIERACSARRRAARPPRPPTRPSASARSSRR